jgi:predicted site-specific integrase-resolvase
VGVSWVSVRNWVEAGHVEALLVAGRRERYVEAEQVETWALMR